MKVRIYEQLTDNGTKYEPGPEGMDVELDAATIKWLRDNTSVLNKPEAAPEPGG